MRRTLLGGVKVIPADMTRPLRIRPFWPFFHELCAAVCCVTSGEKLPSNQLTETEAQDSRTLL